MQSVQWDVVDSTSTTYGLQVVDRQDANAPWTFFFTSVSLDAYPQMMEAAAQGIGYGSNAVGVTFPADLDEWNIQERGEELPAGTVEIYHHDFGSAILPQATFYAILQVVAERLLARPNQSTNWCAAMRTALAQLQTKLA